MLAIYKRELRSYFSGMFGAVYLAFYLLFSGLFTSVLCLFGRASSIELTYGYTAFVFLLSIPLLSLRGFCEERRQKTDLLLRSLPIGSHELVLGKFFAMVTLTLTGQILGFCPIVILSFYGRINLIASLSATLAYLLAGCALIAVGLYLSSLTENVLTSALTVFGAMLLIYFLPDLVLLLPTTAIGSFSVITLLILAAGLIARQISRSMTVFCLSVSLLECANIALLAFAPKAMEGLAARIFSSLSITGRLANFTTYGLFDLQGLIYFAVICLLFLYFTVLSLELRRQV